MSDRTEPLWRGATLGVGLAAALWLAGSLVACDEEGVVGAPCWTESDCPDPLICDYHQGKGSCQEAHDHGDTDGETDGDTDGETDGGTDGD